MRNILIGLLFFNLITAVCAQDKDKYISDLESKAANNFYEGEYKLAYAKYYKLYLADSNNVEYNYFYAVSNIEANVNPKKAINNLLFVKQKDNSKTKVIFYLAKAKMLIYKFVEAIELFNYFLEIGTDKNLIKKADHLIVSCKNAIELMNNPVNISFESLGTNINSRLDDYNPFVSEDESFIVFTSNKKYDPDYGTYIQNIYRSEYKNGEWKMPVNQSKINTYDNEELLSVTDNGNKIFLRNHLDREYSDILIADRTGKSYKYNKKYDAMFNVLNSKSIEKGATMLPDGNAYIIASTRTGSIGGSDLFIIRKLPDNTWSKAENLGNIINTEFDEAYPNLSPDGNSLYFASKGHNSIGGYDIFVSYWNIPRQEWTKPINLGYPINTTNDNTTISFTKNNRYAYISSVRKEGSGGRDIYRITFEDTEKEYTLFKSEILIGDSLNNKPLIAESNDLEIVVFDSYGNIFGQYLPKKNSNQFILILPVGNFELSINCSGFQEYNENIKVKGKADYIKETDKKIYLLPN